HLSQLAISFLSPTPTAISLTTSPKPAANNLALFIFLSLAHQASLFHHLTSQQFQSPHQLHPSAQTPTQPRPLPFVTMYASTRTEERVNSVVIIQMYARDYLKGGRLPNHIDIRKVYANIARHASRKRWQLSKPSTNALPGKFNMSGFADWRGDRKHWTECGKLPFFGDLEMFMALFVLCQGKVTAALAEGWKELDIEFALLDSKRPVVVPQFWTGANLTNPQWWIDNCRPLCDADMLAEYFFPKCDLKAIYTAHNRVKYIDPPVGRPDMDRAKKGGRPKSKTSKGPRNKEGIWEELEMGYGDELFMWSRLEEAPGSKRKTMAGADTGVSLDDAAAEEAKKWQKTTVTTPWKPTKTRERAVSSDNVLTVDVSSEFAQPFELERANTETRLRRAEKLIRKQGRENREMKLWIRKLHKDKKKLEALYKEAVAETDHEEKLAVGSRLVEMDKED
ncbi:hypothetical protein QBC39DRAFT_415424, partial [Podospora conica]